MLTNFDFTNSGNLECLRCPGDILFSVKFVCCDDCYCNVTEKTVFYGFVMKLSEYTGNGSRIMSLNSPGGTILLVVTS